MSGFRYSFVSFFIYCYAFLVHLLPLPLLLIQVLLSHTVLLRCIFRISSPKVLLPTATTPKPSTSKAQYSDVNSYHYHFWIPYDTLYNMPQTLF